MEVERERDKELLWIAKEAMGAALPAGAELSVGRVWERNRFNYE